MPHIKVQPDGFLILPDEDSKAHTASLAKCLGQSNCNEAFANVIFHCKNNTKFRANKLVLGYSSKLLGKIFQTNCDLATHLDLTYDILCPGFEPEAVKRILEILYTGETYINANNLKLYKEMRSILTALEISMTLPDLAQSYITPESLLGIKQERMSDFVDVGFGAEYGSPILINEVFRPFVCTLCDSEFQHSEDFQKHLDSHTGDLTIEEIDLESESQEQNAEKNRDKSGPTIDQFLAPKRKKDSSSEGSKKKLRKYAQGSHSEGGSNERKSHTEVKPIRDNSPVNKSSKSATTKSSSSEAGRNPQRSVDDDSAETGSPRLVVRYYDCYLCDTVIGHYSNLLYHFSSSHFQEETKRFYGSQEWTCSLCTDEVTSENQLIRHLATKHNILEKVIPSRADLEKKSFFKSSAIVKAEKAEAKMIKSTTMNNNKKRESSKNDQRGYVKEISNSSKGYKCNLCDSKIRHYRNLLAHMAMIHYKDELKSKYGEREWECGNEDCKKLFDSERKLLSHLANRHSDFESLLPPKNSFKISAMPQSGKKIAAKKNGLKKTSRRLQPTSMKSKIRERKFNCPECSAICLRSADLMIHIALIHHRQEITAMFTKFDDKFGCNTCPKVLGSEKSLIYHLMTTHKALSEHIPKGQSFKVGEKRIDFRKKLKKDKSDLDIKKEVSDGDQDDDEEEEEAQFECGICKAVTSSKFSHARHMAWVHYKDELKQFYGETENECGLCNVKTKDEMSLVRHIASVHNELKKIMENVKGKERSKGVQKDEIKMATKDENKSIDDSSDAPSE